MIHQFISRSEHPNFSSLSSSIAHACHMQCLCKSDVDLELGEEKSLGAGPFCACLEGLVEAEPIKNEQWIRPGWKWDQQPKNINFAIYIYTYIHNIYIIYMNGVLASRHL